MEKQLKNDIKKLNQVKQTKKAVKDFIQIVKNIDDPRTRHCDYPLHEILFIAIVTVLCGGNSYPDMETFGKAQLQWLKKFLKLEKGIPAHDTFLRVFQLLKPESLEEVYRHIFDSLKHKGKHIAIDGKASRGCYNIKGQSLLHTVSAFDTETGIALGQIATKNELGKEIGEFETIPKLVKTLDVKGKLVTIDAGGCYAEIVESVVEGKGDYAVTLKENQPTLYKEAKIMFQEAERTDFADVPCFEESNRGHGREEKRTYHAILVPKTSELHQKWPKLKTFVLGRFERREKGKEATVFERLYISSLDCREVQRLGQTLRSHWAIENSLHWVLDVSLDEDGNRTRRGHGAENLTKLRRLAIGMLNQVKGKRSTPAAMYQAALDPDFRTKILKNFLMR